MTRDEILEQAEIFGLRWNHVTDDQIAALGAFIVKGVKNECVACCNRVAAIKWRSFKGLSDRQDQKGDRHTEGMYDGAEACARAIEEHFTEDQR